MASKKITFTVDEEQLARVQALVASGKASSLSGFVQHAVGLALDDVAAWDAVLADALRAMGGPLSAEEKAWADEVLGVRWPPSDAKDLRRLDLDIEVVER